LENEELNNVPVLVYANKQDLDIALGPEEITEYMNLDKISNRQWSIVACSAISKEGLTEGIEWIVENLQKK
jgi:ADP-ribosylation factor-like protein 3